MTFKIIDFEQKASIKVIGVGGAGGNAINRMLGSINLNPEGDKVKCPTLVIGGIHDAVRPPETAKAVADSIPGSEYVEAETGHFMAVQTPELFLELALPFLRG